MVEETAARMVERRRGRWFSPALSWFCYRTEGSRVGLGSTTHGAVTLTVHRIMLHLCFAGSHLCSPMNTKTGLVLR